MIMSVHRATTSMGATPGAGACTVDLGVGGGGEMTASYERSKYQLFLTILCRLNAQKYISKQRVPYTALPFVQRQLRSTL